MTRDTGRRKWWIAVAVNGREFWLFPFTGERGRQRTGNKVYGLIVGRVRD